MPKGARCSWPSNDVGTLNDSENQEFVRRSRHTYRSQAISFKLQLDQRSGRKSSFDRGNSFRTGGGRIGQFVDRPGAPGGCPMSKAIWQSSGSSRTASIKVSPPAL